MSCHLLTRALTRVLLPIACCQSGLLFCSKTKSKKDLPHSYGESAASAVSVKNTTNRFISFLRQLNKFSYQFSTSFDRTTTRVTHFADDVMMHTISGVTKNVQKIPKKYSERERKVGFYTSPTSCLAVTSVS